LKLVIANRNPTKEFDFIGDARGRHLVPANESMGAAILLRRQSASVLGIESAIMRAPISSREENDIAASSPISLLVTDGCPALSLQWEAEGVVRLLSALMQIALQLNMVDMKQMAVAGVEGKADPPRTPRGRVCRPCGGVSAAAVGTDLRALLRINWKEFG
jgi:hypothetical protein